MMNALVQTDGRRAAPALASAQQLIAEKAQYLTFMLGGEVFAIGILAIKEIIEYRGLTEVPMMPDCIRGVINLRGAVVPVMDLSARFGKHASEIGKRTCIVIVEVDTGEERQDIGVIVDAVNAVLEIAASEIEPPPAFGARIRTDFIQGMGKVDGKFVILLNVNHVLSVDEVGVLAEMGASVQASQAAAASA
ncbi:purine-binding chemotaxis protein CheW [Noviherbaspirillum sedimenti]|uniref:Chemotaxis protein CheW n=2 Tax=Noviherbaspirillum sedimenti TaxID=2320865 RepID=A0A3A3G0N2_9BURK|nr:purine-binding chemotaxis protein CheW [Noviherbaspirillum sedimenti]